MAEHTPTSKKVVTTVFIALVLDLLAFTIPLPLFPRLIAWYLQKEQEAGSTILTRLLELSHSWRSLLLSSSKQVLSDSSTKNWDVVLLGGAMGSLFSFCQCIISPSLGSLSDKYGRKNILLATMMGNILSAIIWAQSTTFASFLLSRLVGGLSEGNVQLSTAIISDVTTSSTRSKSLALVGIAFSICFTLGPSLGAYFASRPMPTSSGLADKWNVYATPALISLGLLVAETLYLAVSLPETRWNKKVMDAVPKDATPTALKQSAPARLGRLRMIGWLHCIFLLFFSGAEFTLTFLTYDLFAASNSQNGRLLSFIGILAATLQARHVRPSLARRGELNVSLGGLYSSSLAFFLLALLPLSYIRSSGPISTTLLYGAAASLAYTSATVVTGLTAAAAACCDEDDAEDKAGKASNSELRRGRALGKFRSKGQLGRAMGPILASSLYWLRGPSTCYSLLAACTFSLGLYLTSQLKRERGRLVKQQ